MKHSFENSSMLHSCTYDPEAKEMTVTFVTGKIYIYKDVDKSDYDGLCSAESAGKYFNGIKGRLNIK